MAVNDIPEDQFTKIEMDEITYEDATIYHNVRWVDKTKPYAIISSQHLCDMINGQAIRHEHIQSGSQTIILGCGACVTIGHLILMVLGYHDERKGWVVKSSTCMVKIEDYESHTSESIG